jgi:hypothetical protein
MSVCCPFCGGEIPERVKAAHPVLIRGSTGYLMFANAETLIHRCSSLTAEEEAVLLRDAGWAFDHNPNSGLGRR